MIPAGRIVLSPLVAIGIALSTFACTDAPRAVGDGERDAAGQEARAIPENAVSPDLPSDLSSDLPVIAITVDDLPWIGALRPGGSRAEALGGLIDALVGRGVPATGFANCDRAGAGAPLLRMWVEAGLELGNHTAAHLDLNRAPLDRWLEDARRCDRFLRELTGQSRVWFRYPYLHQGPTAERQEAALALLTELGSPIAHVTIDNSDWILAVAYGEAVAAGDSGRAAAVAEAFVVHIERALEHYRQAAIRKVGRDVPHVLLLHANLLVAEHIGALIDRLRSEHGVRFVGLAEARRDPIYDLPDGYTGEKGLSWLYRMEPATPEWVEWDDAEARRLRERWRE